MFGIIDSEKCFSQDISPYYLIKGEFDVCEPYFRAKVESAAESPPKRRKKNNKNTKPPSVADIETQKRHQELRPQLISCIKSLNKVWPDRWKDIKLPRTIKTVEAETIDFPSIQAMVETAHGRFNNINDEEQEEAAQFTFSDYTTKELDLFSIFNLVCINAENKLKLLQITPSCQYLIPPKSTFLMGSIANSAKQLGSYGKKK
jgi:hypothetical protein